jgi:superfamily II DNA helicase RecQ
VPLRSVCNELANTLSASGCNIKAVAYHAGLAAAERSKIQSMWTSPLKNFGSEKSPPAFYVVVATNAFGMGIDNPHVRFVIHWTPPRSFEGFVQESGRAGRDGRAAISLVYYNPQERERVIDRIRRDPDGSLDLTTSGLNLVGKKRAFGCTAEAGSASKVRNREALLESFQKVVRYCESTTRCRHEIIQEYSGDLEHEQQEQIATSTSITSQPSLCDFACDFCKEGTVALRRRRELMASESLPQDYFDAPDAPGQPVMQKIFGICLASALLRPRDDIT